MALEKRVRSDSIEIVEINNQSFVEVREVTEILEDGNVISSAYHRYTISSGDDYSDKDNRVQAICNVIFGAS